jgi:hypothetical protein
VGYGVSEYTLVFRSVPSAKSGGAGGAWTVVRPVQHMRSGEPHESESQPQQTSIARVFAVPICSALSLEGIAYEQFLNCSGVLQESLQLLADVSLDDPLAVETTRRQIQSLVMAAEVDNIVSGMMKGA